MAVDLTRCLILDLELIPGDAPAAERIIKIGALRTDTGQSLERNVKPHTLNAAINALNTLAQGAEVLMGHHVLGFDLPLLHEIASELPFELSVLTLPVIDTLLLSPLAFPQNPYHRLIKGYKLIRDSLNSPLSDCRATQILFDDQLDAFARLARSHPQELAAYHGLTVAGVGPPPQALHAQALNPQALNPQAFDQVADATPTHLVSNPSLDQLFRRFTQEPPPGLPAIAEALPSLVRESDPALSRTLKVCSTALDQLIDGGVTNTLAWPLAYVLAWLRVSDGNSVLAPWVMHQFPVVATLIETLRDTPCGQAGCGYCRTTHDPRHELQRYFGFDDFRYEAPGQSMQHDVVLAGMRGTSVLTVLATGGGKSVCYQLPALSRFHRNASLTVIISPLQSLMKDQVDGLLALNIASAAALNGLLTLPERADVLDRIQMGDIGLLLVSPEQFRNRGFRRAIEQRQVGGWVFDEAHCLSKWGNDFRPDYLYAARYIGQYTGGNRLAPVSCFTATAKLDVLEDIRTHFADTLRISFVEFIGTPERPNLQFEVRPVDTGDKPRAIDQLLNTHLAKGVGGAVVFVASRANAEEFADYLQTRNWACAYYHAGLQPNEKKDIQDSFQRGELRVITATNAFGMGVDKKDVRLVVHADIPGSLENYLQEAGRAGRDQADAWCVLLYDPADIETQFNLSERSRLQQRDIQQILNKLRIEARRRRDDVLVITAGEILLDDKTRVSFDAEDADAQTKVVTAVAWLERAEFLAREENRTTIFPARLTLDLPTALKRLDAAELSEVRRQSYQSILQHLYTADSDERINTDTLMRITGMSSEIVSSALRQMEQLGVLQNDTRITLYVRHGVVSTASERLQQSLLLEKVLFELLPEQAPEADEGDWMDLNLPALTTRLREATGLPMLLPMQVNRLLMSLSQDRDGETRRRSVLELRHLNRDYLKMRLRDGCRWRQLRTLGERRRAVAQLMLPFLVSKIRPGIVGKDVLVDTTFGELNTLIDRDIDLCAKIKPEQRQPAIQHVLLYLHQQEVLTLNHGMSVMRSAMTIELNDHMREQRFLKQHFQKLDEHYRERRIQVHVMREYAELALADMADALRLVLHYFSDTRTRFNRRYFHGKAEILKLATSEASWQAIVENLNDTQRALVADNSDSNQLVLAGPGSGKTRVIVHRVAYLLRVRRIPAANIIVLTFNRHAASEIRKRLAALVERDAWGLSVMTYHAMAMRLTGTSFTDRAESVSEEELEATLVRAAELLEGRLNVEGEDDARDQLLQGYSHVLVDEYQDIDEHQYRLVYALMHQQDRLDQNMCILAVGDDDQNIYEWRGGSNRYIERYQQDYGARTRYLIDNYRSTAAIIDCANRLIDANPGRLKTEHPVCPDQARALAPPGGRWATLDTIRQGQVLCLTLPRNDSRSGNVQAQAVVEELQRLCDLEHVDHWNGCAVLARSHRMLGPLQAWCEQHDVPYHLAADRHQGLSLTRQREFCAVVDALRRDGFHSPDPAQAVSGTSTATTDKGNAASAELLRQVLLQLRPGASSDTARWRAFYSEACGQIEAEFGDHIPTPATLIDWLYEYARTLRTQPPEGMYLGTVHAAKGLEFQHVALVDGGWNLSVASIEQERRLYYVGMTRARETLTLCAFEHEHSLTHGLHDLVMHQRFTSARDPALDQCYQSAGLSDVDIGYAGTHASNHRIHSAIAALQVGDALQMQRYQNRYILMNATGDLVGRMAAGFKPELTTGSCSVAGIVVRYRRDSGADPRFRARIKCNRWEVVVPRMVGVA